MIFWIILQEKKNNVKLTTTENRGHALLKNDLF